jgi:DNA-binding transcriptional LysR family regulator
MSFKPEQLRSFVTVAEEGQLARAAAKLQIAQPALSRTIAQLEAEVGLRLFERHPRGVTLTPAGHRFCEVARRAVAAAADAADTAAWLLRAANGTIAFGFLGAAPGLDSPGLLEAFAKKHPGIDIRFQELPFPFAPTSVWLSEVDVAVLHRPPADPNVWARTLRLEPRAVLMPTRHPLSTRSELTVADVIDERFIGFHPSIEPAWAGFWSLDDHREGPPREVTADRAVNPQEVIASLAVRRAITAVPASVAKLVVGALPGIVAIPLRDAHPAAITMVGPKGRRNPLVAALVAFADTLTRDLDPDARMMRATPS